MGRDPRAARLSVAACSRPGHPLLDAGRPQGAFGPHVLSALEHAREQGITTAGITKVEGSPLTCDVEACLVTGAGVEHAIPSTKGFTAVAAASLLLAWRVAGSRGRLPGESTPSRLLSGVADVLERW